MSTRELSRIKVARRPRDGNDSYPCATCARRIYPGHEYFCHQVGQRSSDAICMTCIRSKTDTAAHRLYWDRYGVIYA